MTATKSTLLDQLLANLRGEAPPAAADLPPAVEPTVDPGYAAYLEAFAAEDAARPVCKRCGGTGHLKGYEHVAGGICFRCDGQAHRPGVPMTYEAWLAERAAELGLDGFAIYVAG